MSHLNNRHPFILPFWLASFVLLSVPLISPATAQVSITSVPFLQIEPDSRAAGMGNTGVALADNAAAVFWNPAGLAYQDGRQVSITHANWLPAFNADLFYDYLVGSYHVDGIGTFGGHITFLNLGEQLRTDETGMEMGRFNSHEIAAGLSYGYAINDKFSVGSGIRFVYSSLASGELITGERISPGSTVGVDLAGLYRSGPFRVGEREGRFHAGLNLSNIGPGIQYTERAARDPLPTTLRFGWALTADLDREGINTLTISNDISKIMARTEMAVSDGDTLYQPVPVTRALFQSWDNLERFNGTEMVSLNLLQQFMIGVGMEYWYNRQFAIRTGYYYEDPENGNREFLTFGAGIRYNIFGVDFSYLYTLEEDHPLANTMRFSVLLNF